MSERVPVEMPNLGYDMEQGRLSAWLKQPGESVSRGEAIAEIETDKTTIEMEALVSGTLVEILCEDGADAPVGAVIAYIETSG